VPMDSLCLTDSLTYKADGSVSASFPSNSFLTKVISPKVGLALLNNANLGGEISLIIEEHPGRLGNLVFPTGLVCNLMEYFMKRD